MPTARFQAPGGSARPVGAVYAPALRRRDGHEDRQHASRGEEAKLGRSWEEKGMLRLFGHSRMRLGLAPGLLRFILSIVYRPSLSYLLGFRSSLLMVDLLLLVGSNPGQWPLQLDSISCASRARYAAERACALFSFSWQVAATCFRHRKTSRA